MYAGKQKKLLLILDKYFRAKLVTKKYLDDC